MYGGEQSVFGCLGCISKLLLLRNTKKEALPAKEGYVTYKPNESSVEFYRLLRIW